MGYLLWGCVRGGERELVVVKAALFFFEEMRWDGCGWLRCCDIAGAEYEAGRGEAAGEEVECFLLDEGLPRGFYGRLPRVGCVEDAAGVGFEPLNLFRRVSWKDTEA